MPAAFRTCTSACPSSRRTTHRPRSNSRRSKRPARNDRTIPCRRAVHRRPFRRPVYGRPIRRSRRSGCHRCLPRRCRKAPHRPRTCCHLRPRSRSFRRSPPRRWRRWLHPSRHRSTPRRPSCPHRPSRSTHSPSRRRSRRWLRSCRVMAWPNRRRRKMRGCRRQGPKRSRREGAIAKRARGSSSNLYPGGRWSGEATLISACPLPPRILTAGVHAVLSSPLETRART